MQRKKWDFIAFKGMNDRLNDYILSGIPFRNSIIRKRMCIQKFPMNRPKARSFEITVTEL